MWDVKTHIMGQYDDSPSTLSSEVKLLDYSGTRLTTVQGADSLIPLCGTLLLTRQDKNAVTTQTNPTDDPAPHPLDRFAVDGKSAVITGASGALGTGIAETLGAMGAKLTLASGGAKPLDDLARRITEAGGVAQTVNRRPDSIEDAEAIVERGVDAFGSVDLLVVASGFNQAGFIHEQDLADWRGSWMPTSAGRG